MDSYRIVYSSVFLGNKRKNDAMHHLHARVREHILFGFAPILFCFRLTRLLVQ